jgi:hypothetical protein
MKDGFFMTQAQLVLNKYVEIGQLVDANVQLTGPGIRSDRNRSERDQEKNGKRNVSEKVSAEGMGFHRKTMDFSHNKM